MGGKDRRARTGSCEVIILLFPLLVELELESSVQVNLQARGSQDRRRAGGFQRRVLV